MLARVPLATSEQRGNTVVTVFKLAASRPQVSGDEDTYVSIPHAVVRILKEDIQFWRHLSKDPVQG